MADANQAWTLDEAARIAPDLAPFGLFWLEEPVMADTSLVDWQALASVAPMPLAAGENMRSRAEFAAAIASGAFGVVQPDAIKWGGVTGCAEVGRTVVAAGLNYCPHFYRAASGSWHRPISWPPWVVPACSRWMRTKTRYARFWLDLSRFWRTAGSSSPTPLESAWNQILWAWNGPDTACDLWPHRLTAALDVST